MLINSKKRTFLMFEEKSLMARVDATTAQHRDLVMNNKPRFRWTIGTTITVAVSLAVLMVFPPAQFVFGTLMALATIALERTFGTMNILTFYVGIIAAVVAWVCIMVLLRKLAERKYDTVR